MEKSKASGLATPYRFEPLRDAWSSSRSVATRSPDLCAGPMSQTYSGPTYTYRFRRAYAAGYISIGVLPKPVVLAFLVMFMRKSQLDSKN